MRFSRVAIAALLSITLAGVCAADSFKTISRATVRITAEEANDRYRVGSGTVIENDGGVEILTNEHVAGSEGENVSVEFFLRGSESEPVSGTVSWSDTTRDLAIITVDESELGKYRPPEIEVAERLLYGHFVTMGCPNGTFPSAFNGRFTGDYLDNMATFTPRPASGRSGSGIFYIENGEPLLVAVVRARQIYMPLRKDKALAPFDGIYSDDGLGFAVPISEYFAAKNAVHIYDAKRDIAETQRRIFPNLDDDETEQNLIWQPDQPEEKPNYIMDGGNAAIAWAIDQKENAIVVAISVIVSVLLAEFLDGRQAQKLKAAADG